MRSGVLVTVALGVAALVAACSAPRTPRHGQAGSAAVEVSVSRCGAGWHGGPAGSEVFDVRNTDSRDGSADLVGVGSGKVFAEVEPLAAGTRVAVRAVLPAGRYAWRCAMEDETAVSGATVVVSGKSGGATTRGVVPLSAQDLIPETKAYQRYVASQLPGLLRVVAVLDRDVQRGRLAAARRDWLPAHLAYLRLGGAYGAFGGADVSIDGLADGLPGGVRDPHWHGLHRLEYGLWHGRPAAQLRPVAARLVADVQALQRTFAHQELDPVDLGVRTHEITEDALRFALTGRDDYGSHTTLATVLADMRATQVLLRIVRPVLASRYAGLPAIRADMSRTVADIDALRSRNGLPALTALGRSDRERVDSDVAQLAEDLAPVATVLEPRRTS